MTAFLRQHHLPLPAILRVARNTAFLWTTGRLAVHFAGVSAPPVIGSLLVVAVVVVVLRLEMGRRRELWLLRNMGIAPWVPLAIAGVVAALLETILWTVLILRGAWAWPTH